MTTKKRLVYKPGKDGVFRLYKGEATPEPVEPTSRQLSGTDDLHDLTCIYPIVPDKEPVRSSTPAVEIVEPFKVPERPKVLHTTPEVTTRPPPPPRPTSPTLSLPDIKVLNLNINTPVVETEMAKDLALHDMLFGEFIKHLRFHSLSFAGGVTILLTLYIMWPMIAFFAGEFLITLRNLLIWVVIGAIIAWFMGLIKPSDVLLIQLGYAGLRLRFPGAPSVQMPISPAEVSQIPIYDTELDERALINSNESIPRSLEAFPAAPQANWRSNSPVKGVSGPLNLHKTGITLARASPEVSETQPLREPPPVFRRGSVPEGHVIRPFKYQPQDHKRAQLHDDLAIQSRPVVAPPKKINRLLTDFLLKNAKVYFADKPKHGKYYDHNSNNNNNNINNNVNSNAYGYGQNPSGGTPGPIPAYVTKVVNASKVMKPMQYTTEIDHELPLINEVTWKKAEVEPKYQGLNQNEDEITRNYQQQMEQRFNNEVTQEHHGRMDRISRRNSTRLTLGTRVNYGRFLQGAPEEY